MNQRSLGDEETSAKTFPLRRKHLEKYPSPSRGISKKSRTKIKIPMSLLNLMAEKHKKSGWNYKKAVISREEFNTQ
jgi:hypothetical protein